jgi:putative transposase
MRITLFWLVTILVSGFKEQRELALENLALRQQLAVLKRSLPRPQLQRKDRFFWIWLSQVCDHWRETLIMVKPETAGGWHRRGFCLFWRWVSRQNPSGRPGTSPKIRELIRKMAAANSLYVKRAFM